MVMVVAYISMIVLLIYALTGLFVFLGFYVTPNKKEIIENKIFISVIIPFRNEEKNLPALISSIKQMHYPIHQFEIIFVNDHSTDNGPHLIDECGIENVQLAYNPHEGKKTAIAEGIRIAKGGIIATSDADCILPAHWLEEISKTSENAMILGPVQFYPVKGFLHQFQEIEFAALQSISASTCNWKMPLMNNGANLAYKKNEFSENALRKETVSGDDIFLLEDFKKRKLPIQFLWNIQSIVKTSPVNSWKELVQQKVRWASKSKYYKNGGNTTLGILTALVNILVILNSVNFFLFNQSSYFSLMVVITKMIVDLIFILPYLILIRKPQLVLLLPIFVLIYPFYFLWVLTLSIRGKFTWKERSYHA